VSGRTVFIEAAYLLASILFVLGLRSLNYPDKARRGIQLAAVGMLVAIVGTLVNHEIVRYEWILAGLVLGTLVGYPLGVYVPMTAMPQRIAISHMFGAIAATLVGVAEFWRLGNGLEVSRAVMGALGFEVLFGALTITGSFMAFGKLQGILPSRPVTFRGQNWVSMAMFLAAVGLFAWLVVDPANPAAFYGMVGLALVFGVSLVLPIGGADMPVVISLLNSYAGLASSATGFAIGNNVLIIAGALDGASGFILSPASRFTPSPPRTPRSSSPSRGSSSSSPATGWRWRRRSTRCASSPPSSRRTAAPWSTRSTRSPAACPAT